MATPTALTVRDLYEAASAGEALEELPAPEERRALRLRAGLRPAVVAAAIGVSERSLERWERGEFRPFPESCERYLRVLRALSGR